MTAPPDVRPIDPPQDRPRRVPGPVALGLVGIVLVAVVVAAFTSLIGFSRLDVARDEVAIATAVDVARTGVPADQVSNCFQGFCFEDDAGFLQKWWEFSSTYLKLVWPGLLLAVIVGGILDGFVFRSGSGPAFGSWATARLGSRAERAGSSLLPTGRLGEGAAGLSVGALAAPVIGMSMILFGPRVWGTRLALAVVLAGAAALVVRGSRRVEARLDAPTFAEAARDAVLAAWRFAYRLAPLFVVAAFLGGLGTRFLTVDGVDAIAGGHLFGIGLAVVVGLLLDLPLTFGLPIAAAALLVGADPVVTGVFLVTSTLAGPLSLRDLVRSSGAGAVAVFLGLVVVASFATFGVAQAVIEATGGPTVTWDGEACTYRGQARFGPGVHEFEVVNETEDGGDGHTLAIVIGKLPANVSLDHFDATVAADRTADLPGWFTVAGTIDFVFPGKTEQMEITFHDPGTYAAVCLDGGGYYVIFEFSMPQPMGWFDEFRSTFEGHVAEQTFQVAG